MNINHYKLHNCEQNVDPDSFMWLLCEVDGSSWSKPNKLRNCGIKAVKSSSINPFMMSRELILMTLVIPLIKKYHLDWCVFATEKGSEYIDHLFCHCNAGIHL